jgi:hypothetical protein
MQKCWSAQSSTRRSPSLVPWLPIPEGRARDEHGFDKSQFSIDWQEQQVTCPTSARAAATGSQPMTATAKTSSISNSIHPIAKCAQAVGSALKRKQGLACSQSIQIRHNIRPCRKRVSAKKHLTSSRSMPNVRVLREPFHKAFEGSIYVTHAIAVCPKHGFSICSWQRH